jgi:hypothetical protein
MVSRLVQKGLVSMIALSAIPLTVSAAPVISSVNGGPTHGSSLTISGSGFGSKSNAAPLVWETCAQAGVSAQWSGVWPKASSNSDYNLKCRAPIRSVGLPHSHDTMYMAGAHAETSGAYSGYNVMAYKNLSISSGYLYSSWYERMDPSWTFGLNGGDNNFKIWDFSNGSEPYDLPNNWYVEHNPRFMSASDRGGAFHVVDDATLLTSNVSSLWGGNAPSPWQGWVRVEVYVKVATDGSGWLKVYANNKQMVNVSGLKTNPYGGSQRTFAIGGYTRNYGSSNNWRYYSDMYMDTSLAHVVLADSATYSSATIIEPQPSSAWSSGQVTAKVNLGRLDASKPIYAFVFDDSGAVNSTGVALGKAVALPNPPTSVTVQ